MESNSINDLLAAVSAPLETNSSSASDDTQVSGPVSKGSNGRKQRQDSNSTFILPSVLAPSAATPVPSPATTSAQFHTASASTNNSASSSAEAENITTTSSAQATPSINSNNNSNNSNSNNNKPDMSITTTATTTTSTSATTGTPGTNTSAAPTPTPSTPANAINPDTTIMNSHSNSSANPESISNPNTNPPNPNPGPTNTNAVSNNNSNAAPANNSNSNNNPQLLYPALHLFSLNDTFVPKHIYLNPNGEHVRIGRQTNAKTVPSPNNGYFDSKVLSRQHAEVWIDKDKVLIKDVKSSNGTFLNSRRLSAESMESDVFQIENDDVVEFGIDIVSEDTKVVVHRKVAARAYVVVDQKDAEAMVRNMPSLQRAIRDHVYNMRASRGGVSNAMTVDNMMSRLNYELQKSRDTGSELNTLSTTMSEIQDTLSGALPTTYQPSSNRLIQPSAAVQQKGKDGKDNNNNDISSNDNNNNNNNNVGKNDSDNQQTIATLQDQLNETQKSLYAHISKVQELESVLSDHESIKHQLTNLRQLVLERTSHPTSANTSDKSSSSIETDKSIDDSDANSIHSNDTMVDLPSSEKQENVQQDGSDKELSLDEHETTSSPTKLNGIKYANSDSTSFLSSQSSSPSKANANANANANTSINDKTIVNGVGHDDNDNDNDGNNESVNKGQNDLVKENAQLSNKLVKLSTELEDAVKASEQLQTEHSSLRKNVKTLEEKLHSLEQLIETKISAVHDEAENRWNSWKKQYEDSLKKERQSWEDERLKLWDLIKSWKEQQDEQEQERQRLEQERRHQQAAALSSDTEREHNGKDEHSSSSYSSSSPPPSPTSGSSPPKLSSPNRSPSASVTATSPSTSSAKSRRGGNKSKRNKKSSSPKQQQTGTNLDRNSNSNNVNNNNNNQKAGLANGTQTSSLPSSSSKNSNVDHQRDDLDDQITSDALDGKGGSKWAWNNNRQSSKDRNETIKQSPDGVWEYGANASAAPYVSAATVVVFGVAAWALMNRD